MKVGFFAAAVLVAPFFFIQLWRFIGPAIPEKQRRFVQPFFWSGSLLFAAGVAFCFYVMMPTAMKILIDMGGDVATPTITVGDYYTLIVMMMLGFGAVFQLPLILIILERLGIVSRATLAANRRVMIVGILIVAAIVTPTPDPFSQLVMAAPMYVMYEAALLVMRWFATQEKEITKRP